MAGGNLWHSSRVPRWTCPLKPGDAPIASCGVEEETGEGQKGEKRMEEIEMFCLDFERCEFFLFFRFFSTPHDCVVVGLKTVDAK